MNIRIIFISLLMGVTLLANSQTVGLEVGQKAPEIALKNPDGKVIALSSLKGQLVLIDFWASWCGPCRYENPNVVKAYQSYQNSEFKSGKGFTVYGVSLDKSLDSWKKAIVADNLTWTSHVSDLMGWDSSAARLYQVNGIPANFLVDGEGIIVAKNLRGPALDQAIKQNLK